MSRLRAALPLVVALVVALLVMRPVAAVARDALGVFDSWGAFRDPASGDAPLRCYAIAEPDSGAGGRFRYATVTYWPEARVRGQIHIRLTRAMPAGVAPVLGIDGRRFRLISQRGGAWAADARMDAAIVAAMRSARTMTVSGGGNSATWTLRGAATAMDAAALGCARR